MKHKTSNLETAIRMLKLCLVQGYGNIRNVPLDIAEIEALLTAVDKKKD